ncbi:MAG: tRNA pseudouridine(38-40) synthase TruA [Acidimicrobiia bacterium]|nr:tRNA pseudouridine(38-40) synthase TruA [Acidimicrobiia bacterium]
MASFRLTLAYDGTGLVGWQRQASGTSVQALVEDALATIDGRAVAVASAGRTDAGVHALGQVASFTLTRDFDAATLVRALNFHLPPSVRVLEAAEAAPDFHARFSARWKTYRYQIWTDGPLPPLVRAYAWHVPGPLDVDAMDRAARLLEGTHDFAAFQSGGTDVPDTVRQLQSSRATAVPTEAGGFLRGLPASAGRLVVYEVCGSGFLRHMVRSIAGTLVEIGLGRAAAMSMGGVLESRDRARAGRTAPAEGLVLVSVSYS